jgi:purine-binding chemotaxis protein CheW
MINANGKFDDGVTEYVTVMLDGQLFGLPIARVQDVFMPDRLTRVPLAAPEIAGVLNLRGRIVTAVDLRLRLRMPPRNDGRPPMAVGIELKGESYGLLIDAVGEVMKLANSTREANPVNLDARLAGVSAGVHRLEGQLMVILDVDRVLDMTAADPLAA